MRTAAQVGECAVGVERNRAVLEVGDELDLVLVALLGEGLEGLGFRDLAPYERLLVAGELLHLLLDARQVGLGDGGRRVYVVVEAVFDGGADTELDARIERLERFGQQVRRGVPEGVLALFVVPFVEFDGGILLNRAHHVHRCAVHCGSERVGS